MPPTRTPTGTRGRGVRPGSRAASWRRVVARRLLAVACALVAFVVALRPGGDSATVEVLVMTGGQPVGHVLTESDVERRALSRQVVPAGALADPKEAVGKPLTGPVSPGEPLMPARVRSGGALDRLDGQLRAVHVPLVDMGAAKHSSPGDRVDLIAVVNGAVVAADVVVLAVDHATPGVLGTGAGGVESSTRGATVAVPAEKVAALTTAAWSGHGRAGVHLVHRRG